jgi:ketosteroid isomerase-like protein
VDGSNRRSDEASIAEGQATFVAALSCGDAAAVARLYADDAKLLAPSAELFEGRGAIESFWRAGVEAGVRGLELETIELGGGDSLVYEIGSYALSVEAEEGAVVDCGKYVLVHERQGDGVWLRAVEMFNPDAPPVRNGARKEDQCPR